MNAAGPVRELVIHADDVGMCHGANTAFVELSAAGTITSGSVMVPCPWFPELAELAVGDDSLDVGVHLTLNAEKPFYRWRPVSNATQASGLIDADGYLWRDVTSVRRAAHPDAVETEWRAQIDRAIAAGIDITHLDADMGSALAPEWCDRYIALGVEYRVPVLITKELAGYAPNNHLAGVDESAFAAVRRHCPSGGASGLRCSPRNRFQPARSAACGLSLADRWRIREPRVLCVPPECPGRGRGHRAWYQPRPNRRVFALLVGRMERLARYTTVSTDRNARTSQRVSTFVSMMIGR